MYFNSDVINNETSKFNVVTKVFKIEENVFIVNNALNKTRFSAFTVLIR